ncbi:MAG: serine/threonine-protein kinase, partial [Planctomycetota bacterium]
MRTVERFRRLYAIKHMHPHLAKDAPARAMFAEEARIAGSLNHPNVVAVIDYGEDAYAPFMVMDYVEGLTLAEFMRLDRFDEPLPLSLGLQIIRNIACGLDAIHSARDAQGCPLRLVHRDLAPANVLLGFDASVRIADFGLAHANDRDIQTTVGLLKGTPGYLAPERLRFEPPTHRADLFSLGVIFYELLTGERLYPGRLEASAARVLKEPPPDIGELRCDLSPEMVALLFRMLAKHPQQRPATAREIVKAIDDQLSVLSGSDTPDLGTYLQAVAGERRLEQRRRVAEAWPAARSKRPRRAWAVMAAMAVAGTVAFSLVRLRTPEPTLVDERAPPETPRRMPSALSMPMPEKKSARRPQKARSVGSSPRGSSAASSSARVGSSPRGSSAASSSA